MPANGRWDLIRHLKFKVLSDISFQNREGFNEFEDLFWQLIFPDNQLM